MKFVFFFVLLAACKAHCQHLPENPTPVHKNSAPAWSVSVGTNVKYSITKDKLDSVPKVVLDYRLTSRFRVGLEYSHSIISEDDSIVGVVNFRVLQWGKIKH